MSERKVLNKYYPPDFDPAKIPKLKLPKDRQYVVRLMAPFNMRCKTCGEYIYKGKKFNARKETVQNQLYMGLPIFRFYIKCTRCLAEITFKVSSSRNVAMDVTDFEGMLGQYRELEKREREREKEEDERETKDMLERALVKRLRDSDSDNEEDGGSNSRDVSSEKSSNADNPTDILTAGKPAETHVSLVKRLRDSDSDNEEDGSSNSRDISSLKSSNADNPTDILTADKPVETHGTVTAKKAKMESWEKSVGTLGAGGALGSLVVRKKTAVKTTAASSRTVNGPGFINKKSPPVSGTANLSTPCTAAPNGSSSLSLLGAYSDSESSDSE
ncbi:coiled-coil domain-containing protein 94-like [Hippocampus comes]|uniref:coiled-coil domain-containing protein 94-like n=1 Tax=Hippocampus comes TaxID=109280 RepID=UPI00094EAFE9|nr:PREDICTED: coiled-coil domain-containing protein 94-like [Hippocampus comes]